MAESSSGGTSGYETRSEGARVTFSPVAKQTQQATLSVGGGRVGVSGGAVQGGVVDNRADIAPQGWGAVGNIVDSIMAPKVQQAQRENFWKGVTAARAGMAITDIVASESPLTKIFGPSDYLQGAQFYTSQNKIAEYNQQMIKNADELARVPPAELGKRLNADAQQYMTGDPGTDLLVQKAWIEQTGPSLAVINRTRFAQQQAAATKSFVENATTNAGLLQSLSLKMGNATATREDYNKQLQTTAEAHMIPPGMTPETYRALLPQMAKDYADKGNFHAVTFMKQSGALSHMDVDQRTKLDDYVDRKERAAATQYRYGVSDQLSAWTGAVKAGYMTPQEYQRNVSGLNEKFQRETGVVDTPLVPFAEQESSKTTGVSNYYEGVTRAAAATAAARAKATTEAEKAAMQARDVEQTNLLIATGSAGEAVPLHKIEKHTVESTFVSAYEQAQSPEKADQMLIQNWAGTKYVNDTIKNRLSQGLRATVSGDYSPAIEAVATNYSRLVSTPNGAAAAGAYYQPEDRVRLERFNALKNAGQPAPVAFKVAFQDPLTDAVDYSKTYGDDKEIRSVVKDRFSTWYGPTKDGRTPLDEFSQRQVAGLVNKNIQTMLANTGLTTTQAARQEVNNLMANGLEVFGGSAWVKQPNQGKLETYIRSEKNTSGFNYHAVPPETLDKVFKAHIEDGLKSVGAKDTEAYQVVRIGDVAGKAQFFVIGFNKDGTTAPSYSFDSAGLSKSYEKYLSGQYKAPDATKNDASGKRKKEPGLLAPGLPNNDMRFIEQAPDRIY